MRQRKHIGLLCQRHMEAKDPGTVDSLRSLLRGYINAHDESETAAARWILARLVADEQLAKINCRKYICELLYD